MEITYYLKNLIYVVSPIFLYSLHYSLQKKIYKNKKEFYKAFDENRDTTRPGNKSFGLNYGFKTDMAIEEMLDTGDVVFMQSVCSKSFSVLEMVNCYKNKAKKNLLASIGVNKSDWDTAGVLFRDRSGPRVLFYSASQIYDLEYGETLSLPFFQDISARKLRTKDAKTGAIGNEFRAKVVNEALEKNFWHIFEPADIVVEYWKESKIYKEAEGFVSCIDAIDCGKPAVVNSEIAEYSEPIILRTDLSRIETRNY